MEIRRAARPCLLLLAVAAACMLAAAAVAGEGGHRALPALTPERFVADLNAKRVANGIPPVVLNPTWSRWCQAHLHYLMLNPSAWGSAWPGPHEEVPGRPGYSKLGVLGSHGILMGPVDVTADIWGRSVWKNPWETAPIHLKDLLRGIVDEVGFAASGGRMCAWAGASLSPGYLQHGATHDRDVVYTYPGDGTRGIYPSESADEDPGTPADLAGIRLHRPTGPYIYVDLDGPWLDETNASLSIERAALVGPGGRVAIRVITAADMPRGEGFMVGESGAFLLPLHPLGPSTSYHASVSGRYGTQVVTHRWFFTTGAEA